MNQPEWETVYATDYSKLVVDKTGVYVPELTLIDDMGECTEDGCNETFRMVRICLTRCEYNDLDGTLGDNEYHPQMVAWFAALPDRWNKRGRLASAASSAGMREEDLITLLCSEDATKLAFGYETLAGYFGTHEFGQEEYISEEQANKILS